MNQENRTRANQPPRCALEAEESLYTARQEASLTLEKQECNDSDQGRQGDGERRQRPQDPATREF